MRTLYQIPCVCGKIHEVPKTSGGGSLTCDCGKTVDIPPLRELIQFPRVERPDREHAEELSLASEGGIRQRRLGMILFALCLAVLFGGLSLYYLEGYYYWRRLYIPSVSDADLYNTWQIWQYLRRGIDSPYSRQELFIVNNVHVYWRWIVVLACLSVTCVIWAIAVLFSPVSRKKKK
ncbi:MAG: hypothetical protein Q4D98_10670 [Planctomycetia bacterium]|nr:hypothetical protein [Planctomycetia bacterium]